MYIKCKELNTFHHKSGELLVSDSKMYYGSKIAVCKIDEEDFDKLKQFGWYISKKGYVFTMIDGKCHQLHRFVLGLTNPKISIDHDDGNKLNNRKSNLIQMSHKANTLKSWHIQKTHDVLLKPVDMIDKDTGIVLMQFNGVKEAAKYLYENGLSNRINQGAISNVCSGRTKTSCGYVWRWHI